ncbi:MAG: HlyC/CorC family transporter [Deltaproteobacteria bacterium]|nr:HlyC/CorC family transporter [Deltaproteobacteria bacterium]
MEILVIALLLILNGIFAMYEIALVSARRSNLEDEAKSGRMGAETALGLLREPEKVLSAIQVGITLIGIVSGAYGGLALAGDVAPLFKNVSFLAPYAHGLSLVIVVGVITYLSLIIGELVPKTIALNNAEAIAIVLSPAMKLFSSFTYPIVWILSVSTKLVLQFFGIENRRETPVTEEELRMVIQKGSEHGVIEKEESDMINEVIRFGDKRASALMTPRVDVTWLDIHQDQEEILAEALKASYPRLLVCEDEVDQIKGVVNVKDVLAYYIRHRTVRLEEILFEPVYIPEQAPALKVLDLFRKTKRHFGVVINEYGSVEGIITLHDLTENILGDLPVQGDLEEPEIFQREDGSYLMDGSTKVEDVEDLFAVSSLFEDEDERPDINTLGGLAMYQLNRVPKIGDTFSAGGYLFEIVDMDGNRVDKLLVKKIGPAEKE